MNKNKIAIIILSVFAVLLSAGVITLGVLFGKSKSDAAESKTMLENHYQQAYYTLLDETNNMEIKFAKLTVANSSKMQEELLSDIVKSSEISINALSALSSADVSIVNTMSFINQTGDFASFLLDQLEADTPLTSEQKTSLVKIHEMFVKLGTELGKVNEKINEGYLFMDKVNNANSVLSDIFNGLNEASVEYPQLIYDGPFSDSLANKETKGLNGDDIDEDRGKEIIKSAFSGRAIDNISFSGEWQGDIVTLNYQATVDGRNTFIQLSKKGGMVLSISSYRDVTDSTLSENECIEIGKQYLTKLGYENMQAVWVCDDNNTVFLNFTPVINNVIVYPDMIKLKIARDDGTILGLEARNYAFNHTTRTIPAPSITAEQAKSNLSMTEGVSVGRPCIIPLKTGEESLAYEFVFDTNGKYYVYVDAITGDEIQILYVISTTDGDKLI